VLPFPRTALEIFQTAPDAVILTASGFVVLLTKKTALGLWLLAPG
jgi:hypothetical protein